MDWSCFWDLCGYIASIHESRSTCFHPRSITNHSLDPLHRKYPSSYSSNSLIQNLQIHKQTRPKSLNLKNQQYKTARNCKQSPQTPSCTLSDYEGLGFVLFNGCYLWAWIWENCLMIFFVFCDLCVIRDGNY